ncbi:MAG: DUF1214 domain-containing protein [Deltaproteobacteria bacterium]|nr:DUF1214 domain-containing protein [Deltaproteobacteria bacterium]
MANEDAINRIMNGSTWADFCDALKRAGDIILREGSPPDPFDRAEGFRYLSRLTRVALESYIEFADPLFPILRRPAHETVKIGADNPDNYYQSAAISGQHDYRIWGTRGTVYYLGFGTYAGSYGSSGRSGQTGYLEGKDLQLNRDGSFTIIASSQPQAGNWLRMEPDTSSLIVRQTFRDRRAESIADLHIERLGVEGPPRPITPEFIDRGLAAACAYVAGTAKLFADWAEGFAKQGVNELHPLDPKIAGAAHGDPNIFYYHGYWELAPDQALVIEVTPPPCDYWNFQLNNHWMESLDYRYHPIAVNHHGAKYRPDGSVRIVVAEHNPGADNWLDTAGHRRGTMCWRWIRAQSHPQPITRVVKSAEL